MELKSVKRSHLLEPAKSHNDEYDVFFNTRGHNLRWIIIFVDNLLNDRVKFHDYLEGSLAHNFLLRMENHVKNIQLREGVRKKDLSKLKFFDEKHIRRKNDRYHNNSPYSYFSKLRFLIYKLNKSTLDEEKIRLQIESDLTEKFRVSE